MVVEAKIIKGGRRNFAANYDDIDGGCLPKDLTIDILLRLPAESLLKFKLVSKTWNSLISNPNFIKSYTQNSNNPTTLLYEYSPYIMRVHNSVSLGKSCNQNNPMVSKLNLSFLKENICNVIGSCDGLICKYSQRKHCIFISNPLTKETKKISVPFPITVGFVEINDVSWFGFVPSINDYIIWVVIGKPVVNKQFHG